MSSIAASIGAFSHLGAGLDGKAHRRRRGRLSSTMNGGSNRAGLAVARPRPRRLAGKGRTGGHTERERSTSFDDGGLRDPRPRGGPHTAPVPTGTSTPAIGDEHGEARFQERSQPRHACRTIVEHATHQDDRRPLTRPIERDGCAVARWSLLTLCSCPFPLRPPSAPNLIGHARMVCQRTRRPRPGDRDLAATAFSCKKKWARAPLSGLPPCATSERLLHPDAHACLGRGGEARWPRAGTAAPPEGRRQPIVRANARSSSRATVSELGEQAPAPVRAQWPRPRGLCRLRP
jgi:hypothetical protein